MHASLVDSLQSIYADSAPGRAGGRATSLDVARGGTAAVHVLVDELPGDEPLAFSVRAAGRPVREARWFRLHAVPVEANTGRDGFIEADTGRNRHVARRAPFRVYDAMEPADGAVRPEEATAALRLEVPVSPSARPGRREYEIRLACGGAERLLKLGVTVHPVRLPPVGAASFPYTNWFRLEAMATRHGRTLWSAGHWAMIRRYAALMARGRQNTFLVSWRDVFERGRDGLVLNRRRLRRLVRTFTEAGMHWIEGGHVARRSGGFSSPTFEIALGGPRATSPAGNADLARAAGQLREEIDGNGWRRRWLQHVADEPHGPSVPDYRILAGMVRRHLPGLPLIDATMDQSLVGAVDIWCPQCHRYQQERDFFEAQRAVGDRVWFYTCCVPGGPWLNRLLDMELLRPALLGWAAARFDLQGFLHWGLNYWRHDTDPLTRSVVPHSDGKSLPPGDTHVVYPGPGGPWSSLRFEAQREGLEDYELLGKLREKAPARAGRIIARVLRGFDEYTKDARVLRRARRAVLTALGAD